MHEIMHGLDFGTAVNFDGSSFYEDPDEWGPFDQFLSDVSGNRVINGSTFTLNTSTWNSVRT
ncbi:MAG TPA: hypothetical protein DIW81_22825, partial [Planctomycetaceae bacterium]|nr:hypothetical protein [Planctomycetaceae bacterium]